MIIIISAAFWTIVDTIYNYFFQWLKHLLNFNIYGIKCDRLSGAENFSVLNHLYSSE
jgi:hypothetical protein